jgi:F0F1-type ATP synthase epsilon subunit
VTAGGATRSYYIDGGFVQVKGATVSVLTNRAIASTALDPRVVEQELEATRKQAAVSDEEFDRKAEELAKARRKLNLARKGR